MTIHSSTGTILLDHFTAVIQLDYLLRAAHYHNITLNVAIY